MKNIIHLSSFSIIMFCGFLMHAEDVTEEILEPVKTKCLDCIDNPSIDDEAEEPIVVSTEQNN